jgi:enoyl-CoA hydratase/carnithine racemase
MGEGTRVLFDGAGHVARITINRPERLNAFDPDTHVEFSAALDRFEADDDLWVAVLTGAGERSFCAGRDLKQLADSNARGSVGAEEDAAKMATVRRLTDRYDLTKPIVARLNGHALGGGLELALACDLIIAAEHAQLGLPEPRRGLIAGAMGVHRLPRQLPLKVAMGYLLTGRHMTAARAYELGLVNEVAPPGRLDEVVDSWVDDILACAPLAVRATKQSAMLGLEMTLPEAAASVFEWEARRRRSEDAREGPRAFAEKRPPRWTGR